MAKKNDDDGRTRKEKALDKLGDVVFGKKGKDVDNSAIGDEADEFLRDRGSSDGKDEKGK